MKNLFVFAPLIFAKYFLDVSRDIKAVFIFAAFCLASSAVYFVNDIFDRGADRANPQKQHRPIASGRIGPGRAAAAAAVLAVAALLISFLLVNRVSGLIVLGYLLINLLYSYRFKHVVIVDVFIIAFGFVLRLSAGGTAVGAEISEWILLCVISLSLFLALAKRREEFMRTDEPGAGSTRQVLASYERQFLDQMIAVIASLTIVSYSLYTILNDQYSHLLYTIPVVIYGIFRYLFIIYKKQGGAHPEREMLNDRHILGSVVLWTVQVIVIIVFFQ